MDIIVLEIYKLKYNNRAINFTMSYIPPHKRASREKHTDNQINDEFPELGSVKHNCSVWKTRKSFKEIAENDKIDFDFAILENKSESTSEYFNRLNVLFKQTTTLHMYDVFSVKSKKKSYMVSARHEIIARLLCQNEENRFKQRINNELYNSFRHNMLTSMNNNEELWEEIMSIVNYNEFRKNDAIKSYYRNTQCKKDNTENWLDKDIVCIKIKGKKNMGEKIIY